MKRFAILLAVLCTMASAATAQKQSLGVQLGFTEPILRENTASDTKKLSNTTVINGLKVGFIYDATLVKGFGMTLGLNYCFAAYAGKWTVENHVYVAKKVRTSHLMHSLELPIEWQYKFNIATDTWLIAYTGPTLQYNFSFKSTVARRNEATGQTSSESSNHYQTDADNDGNLDYSPFNIQWGVGAGFQYKNYYIRGGYNFGIYNHYRDNAFTMTDGTTSYSMRARFDEWSIRLGIYFLNF